MKQGNKTLQCEALDAEKVLVHYVNFIAARTLSDFAASSRPNCLFIVYLTSTNGNLDLSEIPSVDDNRIEHVLDCHGLAAP
jgi:hypothetical protein